MKGQTLKQLQRQQFEKALADYEDALKTGNMHCIMLTSINVNRYCLSINDKKRVRRVLKNTKINS